MIFKKLGKKLYPLRNIVFLQAARAQDIKRFMVMVQPQTTNFPLIRIGGKGDGGYLIPDDLKGVATCFSPGVSDSSNFEQDLAERGIRSFLADYSVDGPAHANTRFHFEKKFIGIRNDETYTTLDTWINRNTKYENDMILQMDIENSEYAVLEATPRETLQKFRIMTIEFHRLGNLRNTKQLERMSQIFAKLLQDFVVVHIHPNNAAGTESYRGLKIPRIMEFTFLQRDRITSQQPTTAFPHPLDRANTDRPDAVLPDCWFKP